MGISRVCLSKFFQPSANLVGSGKPTPSSIQSEDRHGHRTCCNSTSELAITGVFKKCLNGPSIHQLTVLSKKASLCVRCHEWTRTLRVLVGHLMLDSG